MDKEQDSCRTRTRLKVTLALMATGVLRGAQAPATSEKRLTISGKEGGKDGRKEEEVEEELVEEGFEERRITNVKIENSINVKRETLNEDISQKNIKLCVRDMSINQKRIIQILPFMRPVSLGLRCIILALFLFHSTLRRLVGDAQHDDEQPFDCAASNPSKYWRETDRLAGKQTDGRGRDCQRKVAEVQSRQI